MDNGKRRQRSILAGMRVLDLSRVVAGPLAGQILGDLGADVIKVERPGIGDDTRRYGPVFATDVATGQPADSAYYLAFNRNKRAITVDFAKAEGRDILKQLAAKCDILIENYRTGDLAEHGLDYESLRATCPRLIYCSVTGYGQTGPYAQRPGMDAVFQAESGFMHILGATDSQGAVQPHLSSIVAVDLITGNNAALAIMAALLHRERTGEGQFIDIALMDSAIAFASYGAQQFLISGEQPVLKVPLGPLEVLQCADGPMLLLGTRDPQFIKVCQLLDRPDIPEDPRFKTGATRHIHRSELLEILAPLFKPRKRQDLLDALAAKGVMAGALNSVPEALVDAQAQHRNMAVAMPSDRHPDLRVVGSPFKFGATPAIYDRAPPALGEHTDEVLRELLEYDDKAIQRLRQGKVI